MILPHREQVTSLELSRRLKEKGVPQDSLWDWVYWGDEDWTWTLDEDWTWTLEKHPYGKNCRPDIHWCSAYTIAELGVLLARGEYKPPEPYTCGWYFTKDDGHQEAFSTEVEARGLMLEWLIDNDKVKA